MTSTVYLPFDGGREGHNGVVITSPLPVANILTLNVSRCGSGENPQIVLYSIQAVDGIQGALI